MGEFTDSGLPARSEKPWYSKMLWLVTRLDEVIPALTAFFQGGYGATSVTNVTPGTGSKGPFTLVPSTRLYSVGDVIRIEDAAAPTTKYMIGDVTAASAGSVTINCTLAAGAAGTSWVINLHGGDLLPGQASNGNRLLGTDASTASWKAFLLPLDQSGALSVTAAHHLRLINVTTAGTMTLAAAATLGEGFVVGFRNPTTTTFNIDANSTELINGAQIQPVYPGDTVTLYCTGTAFLMTVERQVAPPIAVIYGGKLSNNTGDATNDIDVTAGYCLDDTGLQRIAWGALTKRLDATFVAGTNQGGLDTGAAANTSYAVWAIYNATTGAGDILFSASFSAPTMPSGYTFKQRIGAFLREGGAIVGFIHTGNEMRRKVPVRTINASNPGTSAVTATMAVPIGVKLRWKGALHVDNGTSANIYGLLTDLALTDSAPTQDLHNFAATGGTGIRNTSPQKAVTNTSGQIRYRLSASGASDVVKIFDEGWEELGMICIN